MKHIFKCSEYKNIPVASCQEKEGSFIIINISQFEVKIFRFRVFGFLNIKRLTFLKHKNSGEDGKIETVPLHIPFKMVRDSANKISYQYLLRKVYKVRYLILLHSQLSFLQQLDNINLIMKTMY